MVEISNSKSASMPFTPFKALLLSRTISRESLSFSNSSASALPTTVYAAIPLVDFACAERPSESDHKWSQWCFSSAVDRGTAKRRRKEKRELSSGKQS